jgi:hypothetical protein
VDDYRRATRRIAEATRDVGDFWWDSADWSVSRTLRRASWEAQAHLISERCSTGCDGFEGFAM